MNNSCNFENTFFNSIKQWIVSHKYDIICCFASFFISLILIYPTIKRIVLIDDLPFHLNRIQSLADSIKQGDYFPMIYGTNLKGYGYANGVFYPQLFLYIPALMICNSVDLISSYLAYSFILNIACFLISYYCCIAALKKISECLYLSVQSSQLSQSSINNSKVFISTININIFSLVFSFLYTTNVYRVFNYVKGSVGNYTAMTFFPIVILGILEIFLPLMSKNNPKSSPFNSQFRPSKTRWWILTLGMTLLLNCHILSVLISSIFIGIISMINIKKMKQFIVPLLKAAIMTVFINSYILLPIIEQMLSNKFYFNVKTPLGPISSHSLDVFFNLNPYLLFIIVLSISAFFIYKINKENNQEKKFKDVVLMIIVLSSIAITNIFPWKLLDGKPLIKMIQFPSRILLLSSTIIYFYLTYYIISLFKSKRIPKKGKKTKNKKITSIVIILAILSLSCEVYTSINYNNGIKTPYNYVVDNETIEQGEYFPQNFKTDYYKSKKQFVYCLNNTKIKYKFSKDTKNANTATLEYEILDSNDSNAENSENNKKNYNLELPITYYKGYKAYYSSKTQNNSSKLKGKIFQNSNKAKTYNYEFNKTKENKKSVLDKDDDIIKRKNKNTQELKVCQSKNGLVQINTSKKKGKITVKYEYTVIQIISFIISIISITCIFNYCIFKFSKEKNSN